MHGRFGLLSSGNASSHSTALPSFVFSLCAIFSCFRNPPSSDIDYRIFNVRTFLCVRIHTGVGHTDKESAYLRCTYGGYLRCTYGGYLRCTYGGYLRCTYIHLILGRSVHLQQEGRRLRHGTRRVGNGFLVNVTAVDDAQKQCIP